MLLNDQRVQMSSWVAGQAATYSDSVVLSAVQVYLRLPKATGPLFKSNMKPDRDFRLLTSTV